MAKQEFRLPKGASIEAINIDVKESMLTVVYGGESKEEVKQILEVGKWYAHGKYIILNIGDTSELAPAYCR